MSSGRGASFDEAQGPFAPGSRFQKFEIKRLIGRGGHAYVYHGYDAFLDRHIALKVIPDPGERGRDLQRRAQLEARVLCKLQHPNVVRVIDAGTISDEIVYIIMELLEGRTLRDVYRELGSLTVAEALSLGAQIADGVEAAHAESAIHRDLKPENVIVQPGNAAKVLDFGIAKLLGQSNQTTQKDLLHGTMLYMSPEHLQGLGVTAQSDIYALGTMLYEAIAGRAPCLLGVSMPNVRELAWIQISRMPPPLDELLPGVPRHVARTVQRMLAKEPADRFASMREVAEVLRANLKRLEGESSALPPSRALWLAAAAPGRAGADTDAQPPPFTVVPPTSQPMRDATPLIGGSTPYSSGASQTLPLEPVASSADVPTRTSSLSIPSEPTPMAADSAPAPPPPKLRLWQVVAAAVGVGTLAGLAVALISVAGRPRTPSSASQAPAPNLNSAEIVPAPSPRPLVIPVAAIAPSATAQPSAPAPALAAPGPAPKPSVKLSTPLAAPKGGAFSAALRAPAKSEKPDSTRPSLPSGLPGSGLDDPSPSGRKGTTP